MQQLVRPRKFISPQQTLQQSLSCIQPRFTSLYNQLQSLQYLHAYVEVPQQILSKCQQTFIIQHKQQLLRPVKLNDFTCFQLLIQDCIAFMLCDSNKRNYVQCATIEYKEYSLNYKTLNFAKSLLERSVVRQLFPYVKQSFLYDLIINYTILIKYRSSYVQVAGKSLNLDFNSLTTILNERRKKNQQIALKGYRDPYDIDIRRSLIFYCSQMNKTAGIYHKNIFFDKGIRISTNRQQLKIVVQKILNRFRKSLVKINQKYMDKLFIQMQILIRNFRRIFALQTHDGRERCFFQCMLKNFCPLPSQYNQLKSTCFLAIKQNKQLCQPLFDQLYSHSSTYSNVTRLLRNLLTQIIPVNLIGEDNLHKLKQFMKQFVEMKRYENLRMEDYLHKMNVFTIPWMDIKYNRKYAKQIVRRGHRVLGEILGFILNQIVIPVIKFNFYVTEQHKQANKIFYYRKPIWILVAKLALFKFSQQNLNKLNKQQTQIKRMSSDHYPQGKLRILPKKGTFRPIITFNKKMKVQKNSNLRQTLQKILANSQLVLRNMKNNLWEDLGFSVFDNRQIKKRFDDFVIKWRKQGSPKLSYFTLDIKKCYDSINTNKLRQIIQQTPFIQHFYFIKKYQRLYRNKRPLQGCHSMSSFFNMKQRIAASPLSKDPLIVYQNDSIPSITLYSTRQKSISKQKLCQGSIINYKKQSWSQNYGIPQGLNVSGVLCSLYFGTLQNIHVRKHVSKGILMRLTDDYLYIGYEDEARRVLDSLMKCANDNQFKFSDAKMSKNFYHKDYPIVDNKPYIVWIGKQININTLQMQPFFERSQKIAYAMNVNLKRTNIKGFMKNKLKSLLTNHFQSYFKPQLFPIQNNMQTIRTYTKISLQKFFPFLKRFSILHIQNQQLLLLQILQSTFHDYIIYICMLMKQSNNFMYIKIKEQITREVIQFFKGRKAQKQFRFLLIAYNKKLERYSTLNLNQFINTNNNQSYLHNNFNQSYLDNNYNQRNLLNNINQRDYHNTIHQRDSQSALQTKVQKLIIE